MKKQHFTSWISVENELPFKDGEYLVVCDVWGEARRYVMYYEEEYGGFDSFEFATYDKDVTHWMALPSLPSK